MPYGNKWYLSLKSWKTIDYYGENFNQSMVAVPVTKIIEEKVTKYFKFGA